MERESLERVNPWLAGVRDALAALTPSDRDDLATPQPGKALYSPAALAVAAARRAFHLGLIARGEAAWNGWAGAMTALASPPVRSLEWPRLFELVAHVDLSGERFQEPVDLAGFAFPGRFSIERAYFAGELDASAIAVAGAFAAHGAQFGRDLTLQHARFLGPCFLGAMTLHRRLEGRNMHFAAASDWRGSRFEKDCWFVGSEFRGEASFAGCAFASDAGFGRTVFHRPARFDDAVFDDTVGMEGSVFEDRLDLRGAAFGAGLFLSDARFAREPEIAGASFVRAPVLTRARFPEDAEAEGAGLAAPSLRKVAGGL